MLLQWQLLQDKPIQLLLVVVVLEIVHCHPTQQTGQILSLLQLLHLAVEVVEIIKTKTVLPENQVVLVVELVAFQQQQEVLGILHLEVHHKEMQEE
jgi:hypothetical protein